MHREGPGESGSAPEAPTQAADAAGRSEDNMTVKSLAAPDRRIFRRYEKKYRLRPAQYNALMEVLAEYAEPEPYGLHTICSLYYDTAGYDVIRHSLDKPAFKEKLRLRSYGVPGEGDRVYLELKKKLEGVTYKRRIPLPLHEARDYLEYGLPPLVDGRARPILGEIEAYRRRQPLAAAMVVCYDRHALHGREDAQLRITFDGGVRWRTEDLDLARGDGGELLLPPGTRLMEIKTEQALPLWLARALSELAIYPCGFSKYGAAYQQQLTGKGEFRRVG